MKNTLLIFSLFLLFTGSIIAQNQLPKTQIYAFTITPSKKKRWKVVQPKLLTYDNKQGYNNQPAFFNGKLYFSQSAFIHGKEQTDIVALDIENKKKSIVTRTAKANEYSPTLHPDEQSFCVISQDKAGNQKLLQYQLNQKGKAKNLFPRLNKIAYFSWLNLEKVALISLFKNGLKLSIGLPNKGTTKHIAFNVGRCIKRSPKGNLVFVEKESDSQWNIKTLNPETGQTFMMGTMPPNVQDFEILEDGTVVAGFKSSIYRLAPEKGGEWVFVSNLEQFIDANKKISRIAVKGNQLAVVVEN